MPDKKEILHIINFLFSKKKEGIKLPFPLDDILINNIKDISVREIFKYLATKDLLEIGIQTGIEDDLFLKHPNEKDSEGGNESILSIDFFNLFKYKQELSGNKQKSIIKPIALEKIAKLTGNLNTGNVLLRILEELEVPDYLIVYPNTKWVMIYNLLLALATSKSNKDHYLLFKIIETFCHPLIHDGDKNKAEKITEQFNNMLEYDKIVIEDAVLYHNVDGDYYVDKDGNINAPECYVVIPEDITELYVYWNELIKITKFYFANNKDIVDADNLSSIYFELIKRIENILSSKNCGHLTKAIYVRPFSNLVGCELELNKHKKTETDALFALQNFLGDIIDLYLPKEDVVLKIKSENEDFFNRIQDFIKNNSYNNSEKIKGFVKERSEEDPIPIRIVNMPSIKIDNFDNVVSKKSNLTIKLPSGTKWEHISIRFITKEEVFIKSGQYEFNTDYKEMGFKDNRNRKIAKPNEQWNFLIVLARLNGELTIKDKEAKDKYKKQKELLTKKLQSIFKIDYDPFYPYNSRGDGKDQNSYKIKIILVPPPEIDRESASIKRSKSKKINLDEEINQHFTKITPEIAERNL